MNKNGIIENLSAKLGIPRSEAEKILNTLVDIVTESLKKGEEVSITGFGQFMVSNRSARAGVNPQNPAERIQIPATKVLKFRAGKGLKEAIREDISNNSEQQE